MPYIKQNQRDVLNPVLRRIVDKISSEDCPYVRAEYFAYYCISLISRFVYQEDATEIPVSSELTQDIVGVIKDGVAELCNMIDGKQLFVGAGQLNYSITYVLWGLLGDDARYGLRAYLNGILGLIRKNVDINEDLVNSKVEDLIVVRRFVISYGVLTDISEETYRRKTVPYEESKIAENGDVGSREGEPAKRPAKELDAWENEGGNGARHGRFGRIKQDEPEA